MNEHLNMSFNIRYNIKNTILILYIDENINNILISCVFIPATQMRVNKLKYKCYMNFANDACTVHIE